MQGKERLRVLYVDDDRDTADSIADFLRHFGLEVAACYNGATALAAVPDFPPDVYVLDLNMPGMDGDKLLTELRSDSSARRTLFVAVTAAGNDEARTRTTAAGFHLHLVKPVDPYELLRVVNTWGEVIHAKA